MFKNFFQEQGAADLATKLDIDDDIYLEGWFLS